MRTLSCVRVVATVVLLANAAPGAAAATLKERILQNPHAEIEAAVEAWREVGTPFFGLPHYLLLDTCVLLTEPGGEEESFLDHFTIIARYHWGVADALTTEGYPDEVWRAALDNLANARLDELLRRFRGGLDLVGDINGLREPAIPFEAALVAALNEYRLAHDPSLAAPEPLADFCGGDYVGYVEVETEPSGGAIRLIGEYYFKLCEVTGIEPYSDDCDKWALATRGQAFPVGSYYYMARWADGRSECDRVMLEEPEAYSGDIGTVVIGQSGRTC